jgi:nicotinate-nucleotide pyrophosphorylase (carboxylating)
MTLSTSTADLLAAAGLDPGRVVDLVRCALAEDLAGGVDVTSVATIPADQADTGDVVARAAGVVAGLPVAAAVFDVVGEGGIATAVRVGDGATVAPGDILLTATGPSRSLLTAERTALNLLCRLSGIATLTRAWVDAVAGTGAVVRDTRKTTPGLREVEKYAVRCGGGSNHRMGLSDAALVKDNHVLAAGGVAQAFRAVRAAFPGIPVEVECTTVDEVAQAVEAGADLVLLNNITPDQMRRAVQVARPRGVRLEASGGLRLADAREVAGTGVDYLAVGALTHSAPALDIAFDLRERA